MSIFKTLAIYFIVLLDCGNRPVPPQNTGKLLPPATKLGQGYIFTGVCDSVHGGVPAPGGVCSWGCLVWGGACFQGVPAPGGTCSWGMGLIRGVPGPEGVPGPGGAWSWGVPGGDPPPGRLLLWAVRILLECILDYYLQLSNIIARAFPFKNRLST